MGKKEECKSAPDVEEGEASEVVFNNSNKNLKQRVWTMQDLFKYPISRNYASGLYNLAWAQAVQNKPLDDVLVMEFKSSSTDNTSSKRSPSSNGGKNINDASVDTLNNKDVIEIDDDDDDKVEEVDTGREKEEGELEEGEIDLDSEVVVLDSNGVGNSDKNDLDVGKLDSDTNEDKQQQKVNLISAALETVTTDDALKSFDGVCSTLKNVVDKLRELVVENSFPAKETLIQLCYSAFQAVISVFSSLIQIQKQQNREVLLRLLGHVRTQKPQLFSHEQMKEIEDMLSSLNSCMNAKASDNVEEMQITKKVNQNDSDSSAEKVHQDLTASNKCLLEPSLSESLNQNDPRTSLESLKSGLTGAKGRGLSLPLIDLHKDHDADSLPYPTRDSSPCLPVYKQLTAGNGIVKTDLSTHKGFSETRNPKLHLYETEALKAVSSYQQKFGRSSFLVNDRLPSPTPSEEGNVGDIDIDGEVSSSSNVQNIDSVCPTALVQEVASSTPPTDVSDSPECSGSYSVLRASAKSRDPRLRFANPDGGSFNVSQHTSHLAINEPKLEQLRGILNSGKQKTLDEPASKRQRNDLADSGVAGDVQAVYGSGGWLDDRRTVGLPDTNINYLLDNTEGDTRRMETAASGSDTTSVITNGTIQGNDTLQITDCSAEASLHSLLKDIAVNRAMWMNLIKMENQKSVGSAKGTTRSTSSLLGAVPSIDIASSKPSVSGQRSSGIVLTPPQTASLDELGKIRMKPRDPRRVLHNNAFQKGRSLVPDQSKATALNFNVQNHAGQPEKMAVPSPSITQQVIAWQLTKKPKNIADIMSVSKASTSTAPLVVPEICLSQSMQVNPCKANVKAVSGPGNQQSGTVSTYEEVVAGPCRPQNNWGDVEHLFEGFDDNQKAAIQRERARRIEEQKKLFAAHKLCLVLDLDHTLLNSAKFSEVDPIHDEMLRKKEEQDCEKTQRHLFRFPHMGMWTKLRPGIWNFLEKASKLYELHLYTMGNKVYATEMAKLLDPKRNLFVGRVISRGDDGDVLDGEERVPKNKDLEGVLGMESGVVIIDDSLRVWPHHKLNLIVVERYMYFPCSRRQFGLFGPSLLEIDHDERPEDGTLASSLAVIERIHQNFFSHQSLDEVDVRNILASEQRKILAGCCIVFSRVFPVGEANPHLHPLWQTAEQFGAVCTKQIDEHLTHVVANSLGTDKVNWALSTGRHVVHPGWIEASALLYRRANEYDFAIKP